VKNRHPLRSRIREERGTWRRAHPLSLHLRSRIGQSRFQRPEESPAQFNSTAHFPRTR